MTLIDTSDSRFARAVALADHAAGWAKCRAADGKKAYGIPSQRVPGQFHLVTQTSCTCFDAQRHVCKHQVAVLIHVARMAGKPMPASDILDGLEQMVAARKPVLEMVRHADGEITWERARQHPPIDAETRRLAERYTEIFSRFDDQTDEQIMGRL